MNFSTTAKVRFADVDPAGIVFYPRYFEMLNAAVEDWFAAMGWDFDLMHRRRKIGVPTVKLEAQFIVPSELGEVLDITLDVRKLGRSSCALRVTFSCENVERLHADVVLVCMDLEKRHSIAWPDELRPLIEGETVPA
ncbi:acyl-CoA thioesterase [Altericroceibacterium endophyticum]|uniref:Acyl-CoA thioesterase n=1 Tax=Altericroceibacterium endophyticum TaxID=1808508 RepID=A0A6I4TBC9_9SPHN|nr:acyl-CoA thioesterase [Altericroceibacterium endophyticum]MXO67045.1 acyl-CoA thioesterase [Altericroceibacterium endophyticum]